MSERGEEKGIRVSLLVAGLMLCMAVVPAWPYAYYMLVRVVVCAASVYAAVVLRNRPDLEKHFIPVIGIAILFNPVAPVYFSPLLWLIIDLAVAVYFLNLSKKFGIRP